MKLEDVFPVSASLHAASPPHHSVHLYQVRGSEDNSLVLCADTSTAAYTHHVQGRLQYILSYSPATTATNTALLLRDETMNLLRAAVI